MKRLLPLILICCLLLGCAPAPELPPATEGPATVPTEEALTQIPFQSRFHKETVIKLSDAGIDVKGPNSLFVYTSNDILYYADMDVYESGNPFGEGAEADKHSREEAGAHTVVNIMAPGRYRISGKLSAGQIRVGLGEKAEEDPDAVVELILEDADITCTVAPAILFYQVYECDGERKKSNATPDVDTADTGANLILEGENFISGSYVAKIYKDKPGEKTLWKQDGAIYSYMSMNVFGPGKLTLEAENEGIGSKMHITVNGGDIAIAAKNDGINANKDEVSVVTVNGGRLHIQGGLGAEGDGIDSNGYLVIREGHVFAAANPAGDGGLDSVLGTLIHGGTVVALGADKDWAAFDSRQVTMNLLFEGYESGCITLTQTNGAPVLSYEGEAVARQYRGVILSCPSLEQGHTYHLYLDDLPMVHSGPEFTLAEPVNHFVNIRNAE